MNHTVLDTMTERLRQGLETARKQGAATAKLSFRNQERTYVRFENGRMKDTGSQQRLGYEVEVVIDGRVGRAGGNRLDMLDEMIAQAVTLTRVGSVAHFDAYPPAGEVADVKLHAQRTVDLTREEMVSACDAVLAPLREKGGDAYLYSSANRTEDEGLVVTTGGVCHATRRTGWSLSGSIMRTEDTDVLQAGFGRSWRDRNELFDPPAVADRILTDLSWAQRPAEAPTGKVPVVLPPEAFRYLLGAVLAGIHGRSVARGESPLAGRLGQQVLDEKLTIVDRPHMAYADGAREIDADGIPTRGLTLFEGGTLKTFLYDLDSAGLAGAEPTGNDDCRPYNVVVTPGPSTSEELIAGIDDGLLVRNLIGFGQGNILNGDFSCNVGLGFRIRGGEVVGRVKNTMLAGNVYDLLGAGVQLSSDTDYQGRLPWAVVAGASVSRAG